MLYGAQDNPDFPMEVREALAKLRAKHGMPSPPAGLGDVVATATKSLGIRPCTSCQLRRLWLNRVTPRWLRRGLTALGLAHGQANHDEQKRPDQEDSAAAGPEVEK